MNDQVQISRNICHREDGHEQKIKLHLELTNINYHSTANVKQNSTSYTKTLKFESQIRTSVLTALKAKQLNLRKNAEKFRHFQSTDFLLGSEVLMSCVIH